MDINKILKADYLDIIFDGRNKAYGGYDLRKRYPERMKKSGIVILAIAVVGLGYNVFANRAKKSAPPPPPPVEVVMSEPPPIDDKQPPPPPPPSEPPPPVKPTVAFTPPEIKKDDEIKEDKQMVEQTELKDASAGLTTQAGDVNGIDPGIIDNPGTGSGVVEAAPPPPEIFKVVEQMPEFPGGEDALYKFLQDNVQYPPKATNAGKEGTVSVKFVVNEDGSISNVEVARPIGFDMDEEAIRVVKKMPKWKPGKQNGKAVKVYYRVPIRFVLQ
ncbi:TonB family protein [Rurimicrobium arvi]|uniref:Energy transducer TonB n=1 Tax=Rurimicrobium arvi TaxID=2049916 RepID=A0ABP8MXR7_9BACT